VSPSMSDHDLGPGGVTRRGLIVGAIRGIALDRVWPGRRAHERHAILVSGCCTDDPVGVARVRLQKLDGALSGFGFQILERDRRHLHVPEVVPGACCGRRGQHQHEYQRRDDPCSREPQSTPRISGLLGRVKRAAQWHAPATGGADRLRDSAVGRGIVRDTHDAQTETVFAQYPAGAEISVDRPRAFGRAGSPGR